MSQNNKMILEYTGTIISIGAVQQVTEKFKKQPVVICDQTSEYPQHVEFEFQQSSIDKLKNNKVGDVVTISFNLRGRQWTDKEGVVKTFNTLQAWKIATFGAQTPPQDQPAAQTEPY